MSNHFPQANYSFSGALRPLSKLIICLVMLRGRHRGLPVAIDRAIMVPVVSQDDSSPSSGSAIVPDEAVVHDYAYPPREKSPAPQDGVPIHRRRMSMISGISERPRNVTIEEP